MQHPRGVILLLGRQRLTRWEHDQDSTRYTQARAEEPQGTLRRLHSWSWCPPEGNRATGWGQERTSILGMKKMPTQRDLHSSSPLGWKKSSLPPTARQDFLLPPLALSQRLLHKNQHKQLQLPPRAIKPPYFTQRHLFFALAYTQLLLMPLSPLQRPTFRLRL